MSNSQTECDHQQDEELRPEKSDTEYEVWLYFDTYPERMLGGPYQSKEMAEYWHSVYRDQYRRREFYSVELRKIKTEKDE